MEGEFFGQLVSLERRCPHGVKLAGRALHPEGSTDPRIQRDLASKMARQAAAQLDPMRCHRPIRIALAGYGVVGQAFVSALRGNPDVEIVAILVRDTSRRRDVPPPVPLTDDLDLFLASQVEVMVDVLSCAKTGRRVSVAGLEAGAHVISASKRMVSTYLSELEPKAEQGGVQLLYSAAVGGAVPVLETVAEAAKQGEVREVRGVLNGTVNFILDRLHRGYSFKEALAAARTAGFAEEDPWEDLSGADVAAKLTLIAHAAWGQSTQALAVECQALDQAFATRIAASGERWIQCAELDASEGVIRGRVRLLPLNEAVGLPALRDEHNCVRIVTCEGGTFGCEGRGAGGPATAEALLADLARIRSCVSWRDNLTPLR